MMASVSVVIPVYNGERCIRETLESVFAQTYPDLEIICVDDGSKDASVTILKEIQESKESMNRMQVVQQSNTGQAGARNAGAKKCVEQLAIEKLRPYVCSVMPSFRQASSTAKPFAGVEFHRPQMVDDLFGCVPCPGHDRDLPGCGPV